MKVPHKKILDNVNKGITVERMKKFTRDAQRAGLLIHGAFVIGLPGETRETIRKTINFAKKMNLSTIQVSVAMPLPGTEFFDYCKKNDCLKFSSSRIDSAGHQNCIVDYPHLSSKEMQEAMENFHIEYYYRPRYIGKVLTLCLTSPREIKRVFTNFLHFQDYEIKRLLGME